MPKPEKNREQMGTCGYSALTCTMANGRFHVIRCMINKLL